MEIKTLTSTLALTALLTGTAAIAITEPSDGDAEAKSLHVQMQQVITAEPEKTAIIETQYDQDNTAQSPCQSPAVIILPIEKGSPETNKAERPSKGWVETLTFGLWGSTSPVQPSVLKKEDEPQSGATGKPAESQAPVTPLEAEKNEENAGPSLPLQDPTNEEEISAEDLLTQSYLTSIQDPESFKLLIKAASETASEEDKQKAKEAVDKIIVDAKEAKLQKKNNAAAAPSSPEEKIQLSLFWRMLGY